MTFEQRPVGGEEVSPVAIWRRAEGAVGAKAPRCLRSREQAGMAGVQQVL